MIAVAEIPLGVTPTNAEVSLQIREPGVIRGATFSLHTKLLSIGRQDDIEERLAIHVECDPGGPLRNRRFVVVPPNHAFEPKAGWIAQYVATARSERTGSHAHIFEVKQVE